MKGVWRWRDVAQHGDDAGSRGGGGRWVGGGVGK